MVPPTGPPTGTGAGYVHTWNNWRPHLPDNRAGRKLRAWKVQIKEKWQKFQEACKKFLEEEAASHAALTGGNRVPALQGVRPGGGIVTPPDPTLSVAGATIEASQAGAVESFVEEDHQEADTASDGAEPVADNLSEAGPASAGAEPIESNLSEAGPASAGAEPVEFTSHPGPSAETIGSDTTVHENEVRGPSVEAAGESETSTGKKLQLQADTQREQRQFESEIKHQQSTSDFGRTLVEEIERRRQERDRRRQFPRSTFGEEGEQRETEQEEAI